MDLLPKEKSGSIFLKIVTVQCIFVAVMLLGMLAIKYIGPKSYEKIKAWYNDKFTEDTHISEVLDGMKNEI